MTRAAFTPGALMKLIHAGNYATLHDGTYDLDDNGTLIVDQQIPEIARAPISRDGAIQFADLPQGYAQHIAVWDSQDHLLMRSYCFPVKEFPEWTQRRPIPAGASVEVRLGWFAT